MDEAAMHLHSSPALDMPADKLQAWLYDADEFCKIHSGFIEGEGIILRHVYAAMLVIWHFPEITVSRH